MKKNILDLVKERVVLFDGAMGTQLIDRGLKEGESPELWCIERADDLREIHKAYFDAGADVVITNTFGGTLAKLEKFGLEDRLEEINRRAVEIAKSVCPEKGYVAGDMGPTGHFLAPVGTATIEDFITSYEAQAKALAEAGVDLLIIETQYDLREALEALKAAKKTGLPVFVTMTFELKKRGFFTIMGNNIKDTLEELKKHGADAAGANCTLDAMGFVELTRQLKEATDLPVIVQPNAGQPQIADDRPFYNSTPEQFAESVKYILEKGADIIGSCCGSTPDYTAKISKVCNIGRME